MYQGMPELGTEGFPLTELVRNAFNAPTDADDLPTYRVYSADGLVNGQTGSLAFRDTGTVTDATNANPIVITSSDHGLTDGTLVTISGVNGNSGANGDFKITVLDANRFSLDDSSGGGSYTSGGSWHVTGLYSADLDLTAENGYTAGETYTVLISGVIGGQNYGNIHAFTVV